MMVLFDLNLKSCDEFLGISCLPTTYHPMLLFAHAFLFVRSSLSVPCIRFRCQDPFLKLHKQDACVLLNT